MGRSDRPAVLGAAAIPGYPIHPLLAVFPTGFLMGAFAANLTFREATDSPSARVSALLLSTGVAMGALAAVAGLAGFVAINSAAVTTFSKRESPDNR